MRRLRGQHGTDLLVTLEHVCVSRSRHIVGWTLGAQLQVSRRSDRNYHVSAGIAEVDWSRYPRSLI